MNHKTCRHPHTTRSPLTQRPHGLRPNASCLRNITSHAEATVNPGLPFFVPRTLSLKLGLGALKLCAFKLEIGTCVERKT